MTLENINYIAQTLGVVAILGTFIAVLIQMRQTNRLLRNQAKRAQIADLKSLSDALWQTPGLAELMMRASTEGLEVLSAAERAQCFAFLTGAQRTWEAIFVQYQDGLIDASLWQAHIRQARAAANEVPFNRQYWMLRRDFFMPEYRTFYEAEILGNSGSETLGYGKKAVPPTTSEPAAEENAPTTVSTPNGTKQ
jgi:hypothetical protein